MPRDHIFLHALRSWSQEGMGMGMIPRGDGDCGGRNPGGGGARSGHLAKRAPAPRPGQHPNAPCVAPKRDFSRPAIRRAERAMGAARWSTACGMRSIRPRFVWFWGASSKIGGRPWPPRCTRAGPCPGLRAAALPPSTRMPSETAVATGGATGRRGRYWNGARRSATDKARGKPKSAPFWPGN